MDKYTDKLLSLSVKQAVIQEEKTGCAIASSAALAGVSYQEARVIANDLGIFASNSSIWSDIEPIRKILDQLGYYCSDAHTSFTQWRDLPDQALLATKWHEYRGKPHWHWVVFIREAGQAFVLDSNASLKDNVRADFGRMKPKWYLEVQAKNKRC